MGPAGGLGAPITMMQVRGSKTMKCTCEMHTEYTHQAVAAAATSIGAGPTSRRGRRSPSPPRHPQGGGYERGQDRHNPRGGAHFMPRVVQQRGPPAGRGGYERRRSRSPSRQERGEQPALRPQAAVAGNPEDAAAIGARFLLLCSPFPCVRCGGMVLCVIHFAQGADFRAPSSLLGAARIARRPHLCNRGGLMTPCMSLCAPPNTPLLPVPRTMVLFSDGHQATALARRVTAQLSAVFCSLTSCSALPHSRSCAPAAHMRRSETLCCCLRLSPAPSLSTLSRALLSHPARSQEDDGSSQRCARRHAGRRCSAAGWRQRAVPGAKEEASVGRQEGGGSGAQPRGGGGGSGAPCSRVWAQPLGYRRVLQRGGEAALHQIDGG